MLALRRSLVASAAFVALVGSSCSDPGPLGGGRRIPAARASASPPTIVEGPLCGELPTGSAPGAPSLLTAEPADVALTWIPVLTIFEAGIRAAGLDDELRATDAITILAPTDEAFEETFTEDTLDELLLFRQDELGDLLRVHLVDGSLALADLLDAGRVRTQAGDVVRVTPGGGAMVRLDGRAETLCGDYRVANARIHVIDAVLGDLPTPAPKREPGVG